MSVEVRRLRKHFEGVTAVDDVSFQLERGRLYALVGPNGCGKTSLLNLISGFYRPDHGEIFLTARGSIRIDHLPPSRRAQLGIARTFQEPRGIPEFTVLDELTLSTLPLGGDNIAFSGLSRFRLNGRAAEAKQLLTEGGLSAEQVVGDLSFGQRRVLDCLCVIARRPALLLLDEPFAGVDPVNLKLLADLISSEARRSGATVLLVSHEIHSVVEILNEMIVMDAGRVVMRGLPSDVVQDERFRKAYMA
jgi:ABC-type branched-subunit amino acid transport system ATPase component